MTVASLPEEYVRTRGYRLGLPQNFTVSPDGARVVFLRTSTQDSTVTCLWELDVASGQERLVVDPSTLDAGDEELSDAERALRERMRQRGKGILDYATDAAARRAVFVLGGAVWVAELDSGHAVPLDTATPAMRATLDPTGARVAYVAAGAMRVVDLPDGNDRAVVEPEGDDVVYGLAEHVAGESMYRYSGYWWSPDGTGLAVARVDTSPVQRWYISDPANPSSPPTPVAYPAAGTANADVSLWLYRLDGAAPTPVDWDRAGYEYLVAVRWSKNDLYVVVQSRDQRTVRVLAVDPGTGATSLVREEHDDAWVEIVHGVPAVTGSGQFVWIAASEDTWRLVIDGQPVTPPGLQVADVSAVDGDTVLFTASDEPTQQQLWTWTAADGAQQFTDAPGVHKGQRAGATTVVVSQSLEFAGQRVSVHVNAAAVAEVRSLARTPPIDVRPVLHAWGERELRTAVLLPSDHVPGRRLPVLLDPYAGPHVQTVLRIHNDFVLSQWFADQGFAVIVTDGRGTPGRGPAWEKSVRGDKLTFPLQDQIDALHATAQRYPDLDLDRVAIRGASYGGYLAAAAVLRRPDVFHAACAVAPVTDPLMYDTHWMERYLGHPAEDPDAWAANALVPDAPKLTRPLLLVHGIADDNVMVSHTLRLSGALLAAGRDHRLLLLNGATHMTPMDSTGSNLLLAERDFLLAALNPITDDVRLGRGPVS